MSTNQYILLNKMSHTGKPMSRTRRHRVNRFADWLDARGLKIEEITEQELVDYAQYLITEHSLAPQSVYAHLSTVRSRLRELSEDGTIAERKEVDLSRAFNVSTPVRVPTWEEMREKYGREALPETLEEMAQIIGDTINEAEQRAKQTLRLNNRQLNELIHRPGVDTLQGIRDTALIVLMVSTGIRKSELPRVDVTDLDQQLAGVPALRIPTEDGSTDRLVPYISVLWGLGFTATWLQKAGVSEGPVFRGLYKDGQKLRPGRIAESSIEHILGQYPIMIDSFQVTVKPLTLRRTYATHAYLSGVDIPTLQKYLGLKSSDAVIAYIGLDGPGTHTQYTFMPESDFTTPLQSKQLGEESETIHLLHEFFKRLKGESKDDETE